MDNLPDNVTPWMIEDEFGGEFGAYYEVWVREEGCVCKDFVFHTSYPSFKEAEEVAERLYKLEMSVEVIRDGERYLKL